MSNAKFQRQVAKAAEMQAKGYLTYTIEETPDGPWLWTSPTKEGIAAARAGAISVDDL